jgi:diguanylate cyclase (GGDEF)-like protein/PAS domain S-box-containing protein
VGYLTLNATGQISEINLTGAALLGEERDTILRRHFSRYVAPEDKDNWRQYFMDSLSRKKKLTCELAFSKGDGSIIYAHLESLCLLKDTNEPEVRIVLTDITKRKHYENALHDQEIFFNMIAENSDDFIAVLDLKGRRLYNSPSYARLFGNVDSLTGTNSFAEIHPDDRKYLQQVFAETVQSGTGMQAGYRFVLPDGSIRHMESRGTLLRNSSGVALRVVVVSRDVTERKQAAAECNSLALYDPLTGKSNPRLLHDRLVQGMSANNRRGCFGALMFIDLDNFRTINEQRGQVAGDLLLVEASSRLSKCVREEDTVSRLGSDEFVVLLCELSPDKNRSTEVAGMVAEKIRVALAEPYDLPIHQTGQVDSISKHICTASIGVFLFDKSDGNADEIIKRADMAMYQAKNKGRNSVCFFDSGSLSKPDLSS